MEVRNDAIKITYFIFESDVTNRSRGIRYELSSPPKTLRLWVQIPLEAWTTTFLLCLCCPV
jgi:hypothetical protein